MRARLNIAGIAMLAVAVMLVATPAAAQDSDAGASPDTATPLTPDRSAHDVLASPSDVDVFRVDVAAELSVIRATITRTGLRCEVWARLLDVDGIELGRVFVDSSASEVLSALAPTAGPYFVAVDNGPYARCSGAGYGVDLAVLPLPSAGSSPPPVGPGQAAASSVDVATVLLCDAYSKRVDRLTTVVRRDRHELAGTSGGRRARLTRKLARDRRSLRGARGKATHYCASSA